MFSTSFELSVRTPSLAYVVYIPTQIIIKYTNTNAYIYINSIVCTHMAHSQNYSIWFSRQKQTVRAKTLLTETPPSQNSIRIYTIIIIYIYMYYAYILCGACYYFGRPFPKLLFVTPQPFLRSVQRSLRPANGRGTFFYIIPITKMSCI